MAKRITWLFISQTIGLCMALGNSSPAQPNQRVLTTEDVLRLASYATAHQVEKLATDPNERARAEVIIRCMRITKLSWPERGNWFYSTSATYWPAIRIIPA